MQLDTPVLLIAFNRPDTTQVVFDKIRAARPKHLFLATDGCRAGKVGEQERCDEVHAIITKVDWDCVVKTLFRTQNLGCGKAVSGAINWFFDHVEDGIILEDDCVPDSSFFPYCTAALNKYRDHSRVMHISGNNHLLKRSIAGNRGFFTNTPFIWGWATWRRAWKLYDFEIADIQETIKAGRIPHLWIDIMAEVTTNKVDTWDYQWTYAIFKNECISLNPPANLVYNIGFNNHATHTTNQPYWYRKIKLETVDVNNIRFPLKEEVNKIADEKLFRQILLLEPDDYTKFKQRVKNVIKAGLFIKK
jgi:hypothetical protein